MRGKGKYEGWLTLGVFWVFVILPCVGYGASLTIGNTVSVNGNMNATSFSGDGSGLTNVGGNSTCTPITSLPNTITAPGVYCLTSDLATNVTSGKAIEIATDNVVIDLNGHTLGGLGAGPGTNAAGIFGSQLQNITIKNGTISGFRYGIFLNDNSPYTTSQGHIVENIRADMNTCLAMHVMGRGNIIRNNLVVDTGGASVCSSTIGIAADGPGSLIVNNRVYETKEQGTSLALGVEVYVGNGSVISDNTIGNTALGTGTSYGIYVNGSNNVTVKGNSVSNMNNGVYYFSGSSGFYINNVVSGCTTPYTGGTPTGLTNFGKRTTSLLLPFVSNKSGFDTSIAISNTSLPGSDSSNGDCEFRFYDVTGSYPSHNTGLIVAGSMYTTLLDIIAPAFQGYIIATCNFPRARGWAVLTSLAGAIITSLPVEVLP